MRTRPAALVATIALSFLSLPAAAQNGIQWSGNARASIDRASELSVPVMFWVTERTEWDDDALDDLKDAQEDAFRDPIVVAIADRYFVPVRVSMNSRALGEAEKLGLPTNFGLYIALVTPTGKLLDQIDPGKVASPEELATRLVAASRAYRASVYDAKLKPILTNPESSKPDVRRAVRTLWKMRIYSADTDVVGILQRSDLTPQEQARLYQLLAAFGTAPCVNALLDASPNDKAAATALTRAEPAAIPALLEALPPDSGEVSARQILAYRTAAALARIRGVKDDAFWTSATPEDRAKEIERLRTSAQSVFDSWQAREGRWR